MSDNFTALQAQLTQLTGTSIPALQAILTKLQTDVPSAIQAAAASGATDQPTIDSITASLQAANTSLGTISQGLTSLDASLPQPAPASTAAPAAAPRGRTLVNQPPQGFPWMSRRMVAATMLPAMQKGAYRVGPDQRQTHQRAATSRHRDGRPGSRRPRSANATDKPTIPERRDKRRRSCARARDRRFFEKFRMAHCLRTYGSRIPSPAGHESLSRCLERKALNLRRGA